MRIRLGKVAFTDAGTYNSSRTYDYFDFVLGSDGSTYLSLKENNVAHALSDSTWWKILAKAGRDGQGGSGGGSGDEVDPPVDPTPDPGVDVLQANMGYVNSANGSSVPGGQIGYEDGTIVDLDDTPEHSGTNENHTSIGADYTNDDLEAGGN